MDNTSDRSDTVYVSPGRSANRNLPLVHLHAVESTNTTCMQALKSSTKPDVWSLIWTDQQSAGRGRLGRSWSSEPGSSLCLSVGRRFAADQLPAEGLSVAAGVAVLDALAQLGVTACLKWPNDILLSGGKLGGILCESSSTGVDSPLVLVVGVGINLKAVSTPPLATALPVSSLADAGCHLSAQALAPVIATALVELLEVATQADALSAYIDRAARYDAWQGLPVQVMDAGLCLHTGVALGLDPSGHYLIDTPDGPLCLRHGELSLRRLL